MKKAIIHGLVGMIFFYIGSRITMCTFSFWRSLFKIESINVFLQALFYLLCYFPIYILSGILFGLMSLKLLKKEYNKKSLWAIGSFCTIIQITLWLLFLPLWDYGHGLGEYATLFLGFFLGQLSQPVYLNGSNSTVYFGWQTLLTILFFALSSAVFVLSIFIGGKILKNKGDTKK